MSQKKPQKKATKPAKLVGSAAQRERLKAVGKREAWLVLPENLYSPRSDPAHEEHENWLTRTDPNDPGMQDLLNSMREHGTDEGEPVLIYSDGGRTVIADGDRRHAACRLMNEERKKKRLPPLTLRAMTTRDPVVARAIGNACRREDPPLVLARRFRQATSVMAPAAAAACVGLRLDTANTLVKCLALDPDLQAKINARELAPDVALRAARKDGSEGVRTVVRDAIGADGKVDEKKARKLAVQRNPAGPKAVPAAVLLRVEGRVRDQGGDEHSAIAAGIALARGDYAAALLHPTLKAALEAEGFRGGRLPRKAPGHVSERSG